MILIADSGSTKTEWSLANEGKLLMQFKTAGFNPYYFSGEAIRQILQHDFPENLVRSDVREIVYYGSGCSTPTNCGIVADAFSQLFKQASITIHHDLLGAAHALLGRSPGIACILGTGSNSCLYDGENIVTNVPSLGYMLADEGSGLYIGKKFITALLYNEVPDHIRTDFYAHHPLSLENILNHVYSKPQPGKFLAGFAGFVGRHIAEPWCHALVAGAFDDFIRVQLSKYPPYRQLPIGFVGSVAFHFRQVLTERLSLAGITAGNIMASPSKGLLAYHGISQH